MSRFDSLQCFDDILIKILKVASSQFGLIFSVLRVNWEVTRIFFFLRPVTDFLKFSLATRKPKVKYNVHIISLRLLISTHPVFANHIYLYTKHFTYNFKRFTDFLHSCLCMDSPETSQILWQTVLLQMAYNPFLIHVIIITQLKYLLSMKYIHIN